MLVFGVFKLPHSITCYIRVFAADIDVKSSISNLTIEGERLNPMAVDGVCTPDGKINHNLNLKLLASATIIILLLVQEKLLPITILAPSTLTTVLSRYSSSHRYTAT